MAGWNQSVASAVRALRKGGRNVITVGACGGSTKNIPLSVQEKIQEEMMRENNSFPIFLEEEISRLHFEGFSKGVLWPLFHYYGKMTFDNTAWKGYQKVNELFGEAIATIYKPGDCIFIQDYHLFLLPGYLRRKIGENRGMSIGFFLHIPWPSSELYRALPVRETLLSEVLEADMIGFQGYAYARHFVSCCTRILGVSVNDKGVEVQKAQSRRFVKVEVIPIGVDSSEIEEENRDPEVIGMIEELSKTFAGKTLIVSRDRTEYINGIPQKLKAFEQFLTDYPQYRGKVVLFQNCLPDLELLETPTYSQLVEQIETLVGAINGKYSSIGYCPIYYTNRKLQKKEEKAIFSLADLALITPLRDGMNTVSFEYILSQNVKKSPLVLSEFAGAAQCLSGAVLVNPFDQKKLSQNIFTALNMSSTTRNLRYKHNVDYVTIHSSLYWISNCLKELSEGNSNISGERLRISKVNLDLLHESFRASRKRVFLIDYDGTLTPIRKFPHLAVPSRETQELLTKLGKDERNRIYVITGRDRHFMQVNLGKLPIGFSCEHGCLFRHSPREGEEESWIDIRQELDTSWKEVVKDIFNDYADRTPGSFVEEKEINVTWHYRNADPEFGEYQKNELVLHLQGLPSLPIDILMGKKAVEVRPQGINKGSAVKMIMNREADADWILCMGDDTTDEDMFEEITKMEALNRSIFTVMVEKKPSSAAYYLTDQEKVLSLLQKLTEEP